MDDKTKDMLKEAYNYGWAHAIEEVQKQIQTLKSRNLKPEYTQVFDEIVSGISGVLKNHADWTKDK